MEITEYTLGDKIIKKTDAVLSWRLVHDGTYIIYLFESDGITETPLNLFISNTKEECEEKIQELGLVPVPGREDEFI